MFSSDTKTAAERTAESAEHDVTSKMQEGAKAAEHTTKEFFDHARHYADDASKKIRKIADHARSDLKAAADEATGRVRAHPLNSTLVVLGLGVVIGFLVRGSHRD